MKRNPNNYHLFYNHCRNETENVVSERKENYEKVEKELNELNQKLEEFVKDSTEQTNELSLKKKEHEKKAKRGEKLKKQFEDLEKEEVQINEGVKHAKDQIKKLKKNIDSEQEKLNTLIEVPERNAIEIEQLEEKLSKLKDKLEPANKLLHGKMDQVNVETKVFQEKKNSIQSELNELQMASNEAKAKMELAQSELDICMNSESFERNKLEETKRKLKDLNKQVEQRKNEVNNIEKELPKMERDFKKNNDELNQVYGEEKKLQEALSINRQRYAEANSNLTSSQNKNRVLEFLGRLKSEGKLDGFYGRLGDLGAIDQKYDVAISTACGALDCVVVDTIDTAQKCVEHLKTSNVGSATFIALDKQEKWREHVNRKIQTPENVSRLIDLIKVKDTKFLTAFYYSLRNTLVADDLDQATRIAYGQSSRNRVVTLKGEIIEVSGTMSGGGQPLRGRMGTNLAAVSEEKLSGDKILRLKEEIRDKETLIRDIINRKFELEPIVHELKAKIDEARENLNKWKSEIEAWDEQIKCLKKIEADCLKKISEIVPDEAKLKTLEKNVAMLREKFEKADKAAEKLRNENDELHEKIVEISKKLLDGPKQELNKLETDIGETSSRITNLNVEINSSKRNRVNCEKKLNNLNRDLNENEEMLVKSEERLKQIESEGKQLVEEHEQIKEELDKLGDEVDALNKQLKQISTKQQKFETERIDLNHNLEKLKEDLAGHEHELKHYNHLLKSLKLHNIDELENFSGVQEAEETVIPLKQYDSDDMTGVNLESVKKDIHKLEEKLKAQTPNLTAIQNYRELQVKFMERVNELEQITTQRDELCTKFEDVRKKRLDEFMGGFTAIRLKLKEIYRTVTLEGDAELELVDSLDPFTEGIVLSVRPPKKSWKNVSNLSGGEKTLSSLSLVFALHEFRATPIYVMDEIDAALDFKNVSIIAHYIKERTKNAQFIIISLRNNMFELCDRLFGIYKVKNCTSATFIAPELLELDEKKRTFKNITNSAAKTPSTNSMVETEIPTGNKQADESNENDENNRTLTNV